MSHADHMIDELAHLDDPHSVSESEADRSINDLVAESQRYRESADFRALLEFAAEFRRFAPFNAMLIHLQRSGAVFVETARVWREQWGRRVKPGEQPLIILRPFGPVMLVYDVSQTEAEPGSRPLPSRVESPFVMPPILGAARALARTVEWAKRDLVRTTEVAAGSQSAGCISTTQPGLTQSVQVRQRPPQWRQLPIRYDLEVNRDHDATAKFTTMAHELGHLYCGHVGTPDPKWWPARTRLTEPVEEFEAECVAFLACRRLDAAASLPPHLAQYLHECPEVPEAFSLERVMWAAGRVIAMAEGTVKPRRL